MTRLLLHARDVQFILLLDGLNELGRHLADGIAAIRSTLEQFPGLHVHLTCRTADFNAKAEQDPHKAVLPGAPLWNVLNLVDEIRFWEDPTGESDVRRYLRQHLSEDQAARLWKRIHADPRLRDMARNPLLLWMLKEAGAGGQGELPGNRGEPVRQFVRSSRLLGQLPDPTARDRAERCLERLGWRLQEREALTLDADEFYAVVQGVPGADADAMRIYLRQCRLLVDNGAQVRLLHQQVQEYGAAAQLLRQPDSAARVPGAGRQRVVARVR